MRSMTRGAQAGTASWKEVHQIGRHRCYWDCLPQDPDPPSDPQQKCPFLLPLCHCHQKFQRIRCHCHCVEPMLSLR